VIPTRNNHYVPQWYQRRFLSPDNGVLCYLDLHPETKILPSGKAILLKRLKKWGVGKSFSSDDLYTTFPIGYVNDEIEKLLFGPIDRLGNFGISALVNQDFSQLHKYFENAFEYLDAQKIRTPKGLDWIRSRFSGLSQMELMGEMQAIRRMHCTMWMEAVREIVSAEKSSTKFIISDHPVTLYNYACPPSSEMCKYPNDPSVAMKATQTIFPLDMNHCLILTNLEYAREPNGVEPQEDRTYARHHGKTISRYDNTIHSRRLNDDEVTSINFIIKSRAKKYIAAENEVCLYPEGTVSASWHMAKEILLPPKDELHHFGGEIYIGYKDGSTYYQDEFGRTEGGNDYLKKEPPSGKISPNLSCPCGSGRKFKKCCQSLPEELRPSWEVLSIRERNLGLINAIYKIFGLGDGKSWEDVRREITDDQVIEIHKVYAAFWPTETNLMDLLPHPNPSVLRVMYMGNIDPRTINESVVGMCIYADEIVLINPFIHPLCINEEMRPTKSPGQYKQETLKNVLLILQLEPLIDAGIVSLIPDPCIFDYPLRESIKSEAKKRHSNLKRTDEQAAVLKQDFENFKKVQFDDYSRSIFSLPKATLKKLMKKADPSMSDEKFELVFEYAKEQRKNDPLALLQDLGSGEENGLLSMYNLLPNLELGLFIAQIIGAVVYTNSRYRWFELNNVLESMDTATDEKLMLTSKTISKLQFSFLNGVGSDSVFSIIISGQFASLKNVLRRISSIAQSDATVEECKILDGDLSKILLKAHEQSQVELRSIQRQLESSPYKDVAHIVRGTIECRVPIVKGGVKMYRRGGVKVYQPG
jgi:hypothetical protein